MAKALRFPYMHWCHADAFRTPYSLSLSGMPPPAAEWIGPLDGEDLLGFPGAAALPALEARIAEDYGVPPERVLVTVGASAAMHLVALRWFTPGSRVAVETPSYETLRALPPLTGATAVPLARRARDGWSLDAHEARHALAGARPGHVFMTSPNNPTGVVDAPNEVVALADAAARAGGVLASCEIYAEYAPPGTARHHVALLAPNGISISGLNKAYGLVGLRIGWMVLGEALACERERLIDLSYLVYVDPPTACLSIALRAFAARERLLEPVREMERTGRPHLARWLASTDGVEGALGPYGLLSFPRIRGVTDTRDLAEFLVERAEVDVVPGEFFDAPGHLRVTCGAPEATLVEGLRRLSDGILMYRESGRGSGR